MLKTNRNIMIIALVALVNMLGYGIIVPILYAYSRKFGLSDFENGLLFATYSVCQFISTPIIGRLSDKYGRKPLLTVSIIGTAISFFTMAFAPSALFLFVARALDGLTAGNIPVAMAVISDSTRPEDRARAFGYIWSALNFGFVFGPAISALTVGFSPAYPFLIAGGITVIAVILTITVLPETNTHIGEVQGGKLIDIPLLWQTLFDPKLGTTFLISLVYFLAFSCAIIYGYQPFTLKILHISPSENAILFTLFGIVGLITQTFLVDRFTKQLGIDKAFFISLTVTALSFFIMFLSRSLGIFIFASILLGVFTSFVQTLIPAILSNEVDAKSQGSIMGLNTSYQSLGMILGPIGGGIIATLSVPLPFLTGSLLMLVCIALSYRIFRLKESIRSAFSG